MHVFLVQTACNIASNTSLCHVLPSFPPQRIPLLLQKGGSHVSARIFDNSLATLLFSKIAAPITKEEEIIATKLHPLNSS